MQLSCYFYRQGSNICRLRYFHRDLGSNTLQMLRDDYTGLLLKLSRYYYFPVAHVFQADPSCLMLFREKAALSKQKSVNLLPLFKTCLGDRKNGLVGKKNLALGSPVPHPQRLSKMPGVAVLGCNLSSGKESGVFLGKLYHKRIISRHKENGYRR